MAAELEWLGPSCKSWSSSVLLGKKQLPKVSRHQCDSRHHHTRKHEGSVASEAVDAFDEANVRLFYGTIFGENLGGGLLFKVLLISVRTTCFVVWLISWDQHLKDQKVPQAGIFWGLRRFRLPLHENEFWLFLFCFLFISRVLEYYLENKWFYQFNLCIPNKGA